MAESDKLDLGEEKSAPSGSKKKIIIIVLVAVLLTLGGVGATLYFLGIYPPKDKAAAAAKADGHGVKAEGEAGHGDAAAEGEGEEEAKGEDEEHGEGKDGEGHEAETVYEELEPAFVVNFKNNPEARLAQLNITVATKDPSVPDAVKKHMPMIRNNLLLLIGSEDPAMLKTAEGKESLRVKVYEEINAILKKQAKKKKAVDEIFFTGFVMQ